MLSRALFFLFVFTSLFAGSSKGQDLYWVDNSLDEINKVSANGGSPQTLLQGGNFDALALDLLHQKLYYTTGSSGCDLYRANLDGSGSQHLASFDSTNFIRAMSVDAAAGKLYWTSNDSINASTNASGKLRRANLDGSGLQDLVTGMNYPYGVALDLAGTKAYWIRQETNTIERSNLDGSAKQDIVALGSSSYAFSIAFSNRTNQIYWSDAGNARIGRANADGSGPVTLAPLSSSSLDSGVALDPTTDRIFWGDTVNHAIYTADLNGGNAHQFLSAGYPTSMAVSPEPALVLPAAAMVLAAAARRHGSSGQRAYHPPT